MLIRVVHEVECRFPFFGKTLIFMEVHDLRYQIFFLIRPDGYNIRLNEKIQPFISINSAPPPFLTKIVSLLLKLYLAKLNKLEQKIFLHFNTKGQIYHLLLYLVSP